MAARSPNGYRGIPTVLCISASPRPASRTQALVTHLHQRLTGAGLRVRTLEIRTLPPGPLLDGDVTHPELIRTLSTIREADALVVATPVYQGAHSGLLQALVDLLPKSALRGKPVLPLATCGSAASAVALDRSLRPMLTALAADVSSGWLVPAEHIQTRPGGDVLIDAASRTSIARVTDEFAALIGGRTGWPPGPVGADGPPRVAPVVGSDGLQVQRVHPDDPRLRLPTIGPVADHATRNGRESAGIPVGQMVATDFTAPNGVALLLVRDGQAIAGGALRRHDDDIAEITWVWTAPPHRRRGVGRRMVAELEIAAVKLGYRSILLTTGQVQPEVRNLILTAGYTPGPASMADLETVRPLTFSKDLVRFDKPTTPRSSGRSTDRYRNDRPVAAALGPDARGHLHSRAVNPLGTEQ